MMILWTKTLHWVCQLTTTVGAVAASKGAPTARACVEQSCAQIATVVVMQRAYRIVRAAIQLRIAVTAKTLSNVPTVLIAATVST